MRFIYKSIKGKEYLYAEHTFRLPSGKIKTISKRVKSKNDITLDYFFRKEVELYKQYSEKYAVDTVFTKSRLESLEEFRVGFKYLKNKLSKKQFSDIIKRFTINNTYESNAIEGNSLTLKDVTLFVGEKINPKNSDLRDIYETRNTQKAHDLLFANNFRLTKSDILKIHKIIIKDMDVHIGFKKLPNYLLMRNVKTTSPENVEHEIDNLLNWYEAKLQDNWHPVKIAIHFHAKFEKIHPFEDGNGRVGRILLNLILLKNGFPPLIVRKSMKEKYFTCLAAADKGSYTQIEHLFLNKLKRTYMNFFEEYVKYL